MVVKELWMSPEIVEALNEIAVAIRGVGTAIGWLTFVLVLALLFGK